MGKQQKIALDSLIQSVSVHREFDYIGFFQKITPVALILLFLNFSAYSQISESGSSLLSQKFSEGLSKTYRENTFLHTDKPFYLTGETMWYKMYCFDPSINALSPLSKVGYIELFDETGKTIIQKKVKLNEGTGKGQFLMDNSIKSGNYIIRAYTSWMRNFSQALYFEKELTIINPFAPFPQSDSSVKLSRENITFHPEGGHLIADRACKVAVKAIAGYGFERILNGSIIDENDSLILKFETTRNGIGSFIFTPLPATRYKARVTTYDDRTFEIDLPKVEVAGVALKVDTSSKEFIDISLNTNIKSEDPWYIAVHANDVLHYSQRLKITNRQAVVRVAKKELSEGVNRVTLFDKSLKVESERIVYVHKTHSKTVSIKNLMPSYDTRQSVDLKISSLQNDLKMSSLSVSVYRTMPQAHTSTRQLYSYLNLNKDLKDPVPGLQEYISYNAQKSAEADELDNWLISSLIKTPNWYDPERTDTGTVLFLPEKVSSILKGKISTNEKADTSAIASIFISVGGIQGTINKTDVDSKGNFNIELPLQMRTSNVMLWDENRNLKKNDLKITPVFDPRQPYTKVRPFYISHDLKEFLEQNSINTQIANAYNDFTFTRGVNMEKVKYENYFYGKQDGEYVLDDFTRFPTIKDSFIEYIRTAVIRRKKKQTYIYALDDANGHLLDEPALILVDGIPTLNVDSVLAMDQAKLKKIHVNNVQFILGDHIFYGIVNFITFNGDHEMRKLPEGAITYSYRGVTEPRDFFQVQYGVDGKDNKHIPDFRNVLLWDSDLKSPKSNDLELNFFTSDVVGKYTIEVTGVLDDGTPVYTMETFEVRKSNF